MPSPALAPPPPSSLPPRESPPPLPRARAPLSRPVRFEPTGRITRSALVGSVVLHAVFFTLVILAVRGEPFRVGPKPGPTAGAPAAGGGGGGGETVSYLDVKDFDAAQALVASAGAPATASVPAAADTIAFPEAAPRTPALPGQARIAPTRPNGGPAGGPGASAPAAGAPATGPGRGPGAPGAAGQGNGVPGAGSGGSGGILRPGYVDPRLIVKPGPLPDPPPKSDIEIYREHLQARIDAINRGDAEEAEHQRRLHNWTWKDSRGREWGLGAGGVPVVAGHRLPTAIVPPIPRDRDKEDAEREAARRSAEIAAQDDSQRRDRNFRERVRATRARQDSIRNAHKKPDGSR